MDDVRGASRRFKRGLAWVLTLVSVGETVLAYYSIWVLLRYFATGLVWWASAAVFFSGPLALVSAGVACLRPRQTGLFAVSCFCFIAWIALWLLMFAAGFRWIG